MTNLPFPVYQDYVSRVLEFITNDGVHHTSLLGVSFYDGFEYDNDVCPAPMAEVKIRNGGYYCTCMGDTLVEGVTEEEAFEILIEEFESLHRKWGVLDEVDPTGEFTRGGNP